jgi:proline iminopeptidase
MGGPLHTAWELAQVWPDAELYPVEGSGHTGNAEMRDLMIDAFARFAER